jgi:hypothetical protein
MRRSRQPKSLVEFFRDSPLVGLELNLERDKDTGRDLEIQSELSADALDQPLDSLRHSLDSDL